MNWVRSERYEWNHCRGVPDIPMEVSRSRRMECEMVSKAALRSRRMSIDNCPESAAIKRSYVILMSAVSVLCRGRKPDWNCS